MTRKTTRKKKKVGRATGRSTSARSGPSRKAARPLCASDLMSREPITVPQEMTVADLCDLFQERNINGAPVVDDRGLLVGVVAQDDIIYGVMGRPDLATDAGAAPAAEAGRASESPSRRRRRGMVEALRERSLRAVPDARPRIGERAFWADLRAGDDPMRMPVRAIMTSPAISAEEKTPITDLCNVMWNLRLHRVPIVRGGKVTGLVSSMDLCRAILNGQIKV